MWKPGDELPSSLIEMLDYFKAKGVQPVAYVYPILAFLSGTYPGGANPPWIVSGTYYDLHDGERAPGLLPPSNGPLRSSLASPALQQWLPDTMASFARQTGAGGFSFDYTYFEQNLDGGDYQASQYAQWTGWRTILSRLQASGCAGDGCVIDNRQQNHAWGPWMWVQGGSYAEPLMSDEQPGSWMFYGAACMNYIAACMNYSAACMNYSAACMNYSAACMNYSTRFPNDMSRMAEADLKTDRLSANEERFIAWNYRQLEFCPAQVLPGFAMHQTDRDPTKLEVDPRSNNHSRAKDFDFLGYRYSVMSSVGTGGLNNVVNMLPARDIQEFSLFPAEDVAFVKEWMTWADEHVSWLLKSQVLSGQPSAGKLDATSMIVDNEGAVFVYNPTARASEFTLTLDAAMGFTCDPKTMLLIRLIGSSERTSVPHALDLKPCNSQIVLSVPPTTALAFDVATHTDPAAQLIVLGAAAQAKFEPSTRTVILDNAQGAAGVEQQLTVLLPPSLTNQHTISRVVINNQTVNFEYSVHGSGHASLSMKGKWAGEKFVKEIGNVTGFSGGAFEATFNVPAAAIEQLKDLNHTYPLEYDLDPDGNDDANVPWLAPGRLLVFVKYRPLQNDTFNVTGSIDNVPLLVRKAYNTIVRSPQRFIGYWADVTAHVKAGQQQTLSLVLSQEPTSYHVQSGFINAGNDLGTAAATVAQAEVQCREDRDCIGFTFEKKKDPSTPCTEVVGPQKILYKSGGATGGAGSSTWCTALKPPVLDGVFFDNVQTISSSVFEVH